MDDNRGTWRGRCVECDDWIFGHFAGQFFNDQNEEKPHILRDDNGDLEEVTPTSLGECTGEEDRNHNLIFEKDIISEGDFANSAIGVVRYGRYSTISDSVSCHIGFYVDWIGENNGLLRNDLGYWSDHCTIIGNTIDNPELLINERKFE